MRLLPIRNQELSNCMDYIIEVDASAKIVGNFTVPNKSCQAFVTIRSNRMDALPGRGTRIDPAVHAEFMPTFEAARGPGSSSPAFATIKNGGTQYWRFTALNVYAGDSLYAYRVGNPANGAGTIQVDTNTLPGTLLGDWKVTCTSGPCENGSGTFTVSNASNGAAELPFKARHSRDSCSSRSRISSKLYSSYLQSLTGHPKPA